MKSELKNASHKFSSLLLALSSFRSKISVLLSVVVTDVSTNSVDVIIRRSSEGLLPDDCYKSRSCKLIGRECTPTREY